MCILASLSDNRTSEQIITADVFAMMKKTYSSISLNQTMVLYEMGFNDPK